MTDCPTGKRSHKTKAIADKVRRHTVLSNIKAGRIHEGALNVYQCNVCELWHVGHRTIATEGEQ